jgi:signal transduction histidine kinase
MYARGGRVEFAIDSNQQRQTLVIRVSDEGPGIRDLQAILRGRYHSQTGMGIGMPGARRLMDSFEVESSGQGTVVTLSKNLPKRALPMRPPEIASLAAKLATEAPSAWDELQAQNRELLTAMEELQARQEELAELNRELEDTNRGVVALYADLDEQAEHLRRANQLKSTFLSHMSHEFRTPLNSIMALSRILLSRMDGPLTPEQQKQVEFVFRAAQELTDMVNDLLDLAKVEAGKIEVYASEWTIDTMFGALRGMMRPLVAGSRVQLIFEEIGQIPPLYTDEAKVAQILRNFVSNAVKFTERGEIRVTAAYDDRTHRVSLSVRDTGIGIDPEDQPRIFEQFVQVDNARQRHVKGTGLGLPLSRKLAELLGGTITVSSALGVGSTFTLIIPAGISVRTEDARSVPGAKQHQASRNLTILVIDDEEAVRYVVRKQLSALDASVLEAPSGAEGLRMAADTRPDIIVLDLGMPHVTGYEVAEKLKQDARTQDIPVIIHTSRRIEGAEREKLACSAVVSKDTDGEGTLRNRIVEILQLR